MQAVDRADAATHAVEDGPAQLLGHPAAVEGNADDQPVRRLGQRRERVVEPGEAGDSAHPAVDDFAGVATGVPAVDDAEDAEARGSAQQPVCGLGVALVEDAAGEEQRGPGHRAPSPATRRSTLPGRAPVVLPAA